LFLLFLGEEYFLAVLLLGLGGGVGVWGVEEEFVVVWLVIVMVDGVGLAVGLF
jgi:hypothetical protein